MLKKTGYNISSLKKTKKVILTALVPALLSGCGFFKMKTEDENPQDSPAVAAVDDIYLRKADLDFVTRETTTPADSANLAQRYVQSWIKKQVMIKEASQNIAVSQAELDKKLLDYKYALIVYEYEKEYVEKHLNKEVSADEIAMYYEQNRDNFTLKEIIVRANFIKMDKNLSQNTQVSRLMNKSNNGGQNELRELAIKSAANYFLEDSTWVKFDEIIANSPLSENENRVQLLTKGPRLIKVEDDQYNYYFNILEYKLQDQVPPVEFVKDEITKIIINKRKVTLAEALQNEVYKRAQENNEFKLYE